MLFCSRGWLRGASFDLASAAFEPKRRISPYILGTGLCAFCFVCREPNQKKARIGKMLVKKLFCGLFVALTIVTLFAASALATEPSGDWSVDWETSYMNLKNQDHHANFTPVQVYYNYGSWFHDRMGLDRGQRACKRIRIRICGNQGYKRPNCEPATSIRITMAQILIMAG